MPSLNDLRNSLVTVIVNYHAKKLNGKSSEKLETLLTTPHTELMLQLKGLIIESTKDDQTRRPLLNFILDNLELVMVTFDKSEQPVSSERALQVKNGLVTFVMSIQQLLNTSQNTEITIAKKEASIKLHGLVKGIWPISSFCSSGALLSDTFLPALKLTQYDNKETVKNTIHELVENQQLKLLARYQENQITELKESLKQQEKSLDQLKKVNIAPKTPALAVSLSSGISSSSSCAATSIGFFGKQALLAVDAYKLMNETSLLKKNVSKTPSVQYDAPPSSCMI